jgi:chemotaxis protein CheX
MELPLTEDEIREFVRANTDKVFSTMLDLPIQLRHRAIQPPSAAEDGGVISLVGFAGQWSGSGTIHCSADLACTISGKLLLTNFDRVNEEVLDAIGEVANMIIGNFKDDAADKLGPLGLSTPTVIHGSNFQTRNWNGQSWITVPFDCAGELFEVKICLVPSHALHEEVRPAGAHRRDAHP